MDLITPKNNAIKNQSFMPSPIMAKNSNMPFFASGLFSRKLRARLSN